MPEKSHTKMNKAKKMKPGVKSNSGGGMKVADKPVDPLRPCKCERSSGSRNSLQIQSLPRSGSTLMYGVLLALFPGCMIKKEHFRLAEAAPKKSKQWALGGPVITPVRDPLDTLASALAMRHNLESTNP